MDNNIVVVFIVVLISLQNVVAASRKRKIASLLTFSEQADKNVQEFI